MKKRERFFLAVLLVMIAVFCSGCGKDAASETENKLNKANEKAAELEKEEEKNKVFEFRQGSEGAILTKYSGKDEEVEIPAEYEGEPVVEIASNVFKGCERMKSLTIPPSIKKFGNNILDEASGIIIRGYDNTAAQFLTYTISGLQFESLGANKQKAGSVKIVLIIPRSGLAKSRMRKICRVFLLKRKMEKVCSGWKMPALELWK